ncbi:OmpA family protein [Arenimonas daejeonensis]|uniref:OmpA family protein n=1 Tax=Arenimonas daejeonensis TaxID=370777 RepID=UPI002AD3D653|nr:OmpA family protein [Arenimonas daejeonensis]
MNTPIKTLLASAVLLSLLGGCMSTGATQASAPQSQPQDEAGMTRTQKGATIGAIAGVVAGLLSGDDATERRQHAMIGAGVGGLAGGAIGRYQDNQEKALRASMAGTGVEVVRQGDNITLDMPEAITFGFDSANLRQGSYSVLDRVASTLKEYDQTVIEVAGHTDSVGSADYNQRLSEQRAQTVGNYVSARGVDSRRMMITGAGARHPVASNGTDAGRAENRRVEITIVPLRS